jgi:SAM-dependent methyltransferase
MIEAPRSAFNQVADTIETTAVQNPVNAWMRKTSRREILATFPSGSALVEIGCGTGADAVFLAERAYRIAAFDISDRMVEISRKRVAAQKLEGRVLVWRGRLREVADELSRSQWCPFDGAFANFSLAYEESLREVVQTVHALLKPRARFVFTLPNKLCVSEPAIALVRLSARRAVGRFREPLWATIHGTTVRVRAYTTARVRKILQGLFEIEGTIGVPVFMPPPSFYRPALERLRASLELLDDRLATRFPWRHLGETTLFKARKVGP